MNNPLKIYLIRTFQPHWGQHSGINQFVKYIDRSRFQIKEQLVIRNRSNFGLVRYAKRKISDVVRRGGSRTYSIDDLWAELNGLRHFFQYGYDVLFYLDGEHSLNYLPKWLHRGDHREKVPKVVAMFHQPPERLNLSARVDLVVSLDHVIVLSQVQADAFASYLPRERISTVLHGVDAGYFHPDESKKKADKFICLSVGYFLRDYDLVLKVAERMKGYSDIEFHIVSSAVDLPNSLTNTYVHKNISDAELLNLYQKANVLFLPLLDAIANNVILEALACGLPIVTTRLPGTSSYLPGTEALLLPPEKADLFVHGIKDLFENREKLGLMSKFARDRAIELSWPNFAKEISKIFKHL